MLIYTPDAMTIPGIHFPSERIRFGVRALRQACQSRHIHCSVERSRMIREAPGEPRVVISLAADHTAPAEGFSIRKEDQTVYITGADESGAMYGMLDVAETIRLSGFDAVTEKTEQPFLAWRGVKFNLPYQPYAEGDPFTHNEAVCMDRDFWRAYIDQLATNRYNCLSLWSENPFEHMFRLARFPDATPYSDDQIEQAAEVYRFIFRYAKSLGIRTYLITWNLRISPAIARGLGLPAELGRQSHDPRSIALRQHQPAIRAYFREAIQTLMLAYPDLTGLGTSNSEELIGSPEEREDWVVDTYLEALLELGVPVPFIHRTNMSNGTIAKKKFLDRYPTDEKYISWKYSNAHMYSHPLPRFEELWQPWSEMDANEIRVLYTVRNDDFHNLRGGDPAFVSAYIKGMKKPYVHGFYWGADGYVWAGEWQHVPHKHVEWDYAFQKHWLQFASMGRLAYNPDLDESFWIARHRERYGEDIGEAVYRALQSGTRMMCALNRLHWLHYDYQWHPESFLSATTGFKTIREFMDCGAMPGVGTCGIREYVDHEIAGTKPAGETPPDICASIAADLHRIDQCLAEVDAVTPHGGLHGERLCTWEDIRAWRAWGGYVLCKFRAALDLVRYEHSGDSEQKEAAVDQLRQGLEHWRALAAIGASHYLPYRMSRVGMTFGWSYYLDEVENDIRMAERM